MYVHVHMCAGDHRGQKRVLDSVELELLVVVCCQCGWEEPNSDPPQEQHVLLTAEQLLSLTTLLFGDKAPC